MLLPIVDQAPTGFIERARRGIAYRGGRSLERAGRATRRATARLRVRPNYLVIGAQKSGTTSVHHYLSEHPAILTARVKEVQYFTKYHALGEGWYRAQFPLVSSAWAVHRRLGVRPAVGEATAACLFDPRAPGRVHEFEPGMLLVVVLRDPVERAYSHYQMELRWGRESGSFEEALAREEVELPRELERIRVNPAYVTGLSASYVARGLYAEQLERWLRYFAQEQLLVLTTDELLADPAGTMALIAAFLGIPEWRAERYALRGAREYAPMDAATRERLARVFEPHDERLEELLGRALPWARQRSRGSATRVGSPT